MRKTLLIIISALMASSALAEDFDFKAFLYSYRDKGDALKFKCIEANGFYDYINLYGEDEMRWARYDDKGNVIKAAWATPTVTKDAMVLTLDEEFDGSSRREFRLIVKEGNKVVWQSAGKCATTFN